MVTRNEDGDDYDDHDEDAAAVAVNIVVLGVVNVHVMIGVVASISASLSHACTSCGIIESVIAIVVDVGSRTQAHVSAAVHLLLVDVIVVVGVADQLLCVERVADIGTEPRHTVTLFAVAFLMHFQYGGEPFRQRLHVLDHFFDDGLW